MTLYHQSGPQVSRRRRQFDFELFVPNSAQTPWRASRERPGCTDGRSRTR